MLTDQAGGTECGAASRNIDAPAQHGTVGRLDDLSRGQRRGWGVVRLQATWRRGRQRFRVGSDRAAASLACLESFERLRFDAVDCDCDPDGEQVYGAERVCRRTPSGNMPPSSVSAGVSNLRRDSSNLLIWTAHGALFFPAGGSWAVLGTDAVGGRSFNLDAVIWSTLIGAGVGGLMWAARQIRDRFQGPQAPARVAATADQQAKMVSFADDTLEAFDSHSSFTRVHGVAGQGMEWFHIVEPTPANTVAFGAQAVHNTRNIIRLDATTQWQVTGYYSSIHEFTGGETLRQWLSTQPFSAQRDFGVELLSRFEVSLP